MRKTAAGAVLLACWALAATGHADEFQIAFEWGDIPECTSGNPNTVDNPEFTLSGVPEGTVEIGFRMKDRDAPAYNHGGGTVPYAGENVIRPGAFTYKSPCPPSGRHTYEWTATAMDAEGDKLGRAKARRKYPE